MEIPREFCLKMDTIKDLNSKDLVDAEEIKKRWKEHREKLYKKDLDELDDYDSVSASQSQTFRGAKSSTASNKASGCDGTPVELFKTLKDKCTYMLLSIYEQT